jgi:predicted nucleotidyltransferase
MAAMLFGEQRNTDDVDIVISADYRDVSKICAEFPESDWYCDELMIRDAVQNLRMCNIVHNKSKFKADLIAVDEDGFDASRFSRRIEVVQRGIKVWVAAPEDVILKKLVSYREGQSDKHMRDIASIFKVSSDSIDRAYAEHWAMRLGVSDLWRKALSSAEATNR